MKPEYLLILGSLGLGITISYALWFTVRTTVLRVELRIIMKDLETSLSKHGKRRGSSYLSLRDTVKWLIELAPYASIPVWTLCMYRYKHSGQELLHALMPEQRADFAIDPLDPCHPEVEIARERVRSKILSHLVNTPSFFFLICYLTLFGRMSQMITRLAHLRKETPEFDRLISLLR